MTKRILLPSLIILLLVLILWAPWITQSYAEKRAVESFASAWEGVADGCGFSCRGCGVEESRKTWFGYLVQIEYACGMLPEDSEQYHQHSSGFVTFIGTVHGFPKP